MSRRCFPLVQIASAVVLDRPTKEPATLKEFKEFAFRIDSPMIVYSGLKKMGEGGEDES